MSSYLKTILLLTIMFCEISCSDTIVSGNDLSKSDIKFIQELGLLDLNEEVELFYSTVSIKTTGNFITNKRIGAYIQYDNSNKFKDFAFYPEIDTMYTDFSGEFGVGNRIFIKKNNGDSFVVQINGDKELLESFFAKAKNYWQKSIGRQ